MTDVLDFQKLDVYRRSIELLQLCLRVAKQLPRGEGDLRDQLKRAATSIPLNIAEGFGKPSMTDRARFHAIARGSAMECSAIVEVCVVGEHISEEDAANARNLIIRLVSMLTKMCRKS